MPQFFFHTRNGGEYFDLDGLELPSADLALLEATRLLGALLGDRPLDFIAGPGLTVTVMTAAGDVAFVLDAAVLRGAQSVGQALGLTE